MFIEIPIINANSVDPDQMPHTDLGLHCLSVSLLWDVRHNWVKDISTLVRHFVSSPREREKKGQMS